MIYLKSQKDIVGIKKACQIWKLVRQAIIEFVNVGITTKQIDELAKKIIDANGAECSFYNYHGFIGNICISVNEELIHGIGSDYSLKDGDLVSVDIGVTFQGYICDSAFSFVIGSNKQAEEILTCANACLENSIAVIREGNLINDISSAIERTAKEYGYEVIKDFCGHGCGIKLHEDPQIFCYSNPSNITKIMAGMVLCIEPMILTDSDKYYIDKNDKWTVRSINHKLTCHVEKMVYVTNEGVEILT